MILFHNIGDYVHSNYNTRAQLEAAKGPISFDGVYLNVWENRDLLVGRNAILFVMGNFVGGDNDFDLRAAPDYGLKPERYCTWKQIYELRNEYGCRLGWHTWSHRNLTTLPDELIREELALPFSFWRPEETPIAYPYGNVDARVAAIAAEMGFVEGYSVHQGDGSALQQNRRYFP